MGFLFLVSHFNLRLKYFSDRQEGSNMAVLKFQIREDAKDNKTLFFYYYSYHNFAIQLAKVFF